MLRMALRDIIASVTAFLNCLREESQEQNSKHAPVKTQACIGEHVVVQAGAAHLIARYMGRMANRGKVCTLIMMVMKAMYRSTLMKPAVAMTVSVSAHCITTERMWNSGYWMQHL